MNLYLYRKVSVMSIIPSFSIICHSCGLSTLYFTERDRLYKEGLNITIKKEKEGIFVLKCSNCGNVIEIEELR